MSTNYASERMGPDIGGRRGTGYIWLAYSIFFFIEPIVRRNTHFWITSLVLYGIFLAIYVSYIQAGSKRQRVVLLAMLYVLAMAALPFNQNASTFFVYCGAFLPFLTESAFPTMVIILAMAVGAWIECWLLHLNIINIAITTFFMAIVGATNTFVAQQKRANYKLFLAQSEVEQMAAVAERERIARDLHDVLGHTLSVIVLKAELAGKLVERDPERAVQEIADVEKTARTALTEVREAIGGYRSRGLAAEMESARTTLAAAGVALACESPLPALAAAQETVICLAVREAVTNIVRHAHATHCRMKFATTGDNYCSLAIDDDGTHTVVQEGNGLRGMRERVEAMGGRFVIDTTLGTRLLIELPNNAATTRAAKAPCVAL
jgi:two-component system sensor histidine kinase DesK